MTSPKPSARPAASFPEPFPRTPAMSNTLPPGYVVPNPGTPKTIGILNIIFGLILLIVSLGYVASTIAMPLLLEQARGKMKEGLAQTKAANAAQIAELKKNEEAATSESERDAFKAQREGLESMNDSADVTAQELGFPFEWMNSPVLAAYSYGEIGIAVVLNILMFVSGIGLIRLKPGARRLALWVAGLKLGRLVLMVILTMTLVVPIKTRIMKTWMEKIQTVAAKQPGAGYNPKAGAQVAQMTAITETVSAVGLLVF